VKKYTTDKLRNVGFFGHGGTGKTTMSESMLFLTGATPRQILIPMNKNGGCQFTHPQFP
jgi:translation elongation factor EF-G